jgi:hypothetical protein
MKHWFPVLLSLAGLGTFISFAQAVPSSKVVAPYTRYLKGVDSGDREPSLLRVSAECGVDVGVVNAGYAVNAGGDWIRFRNLRKGLYSLASDFYTSVEIWHDRDHLLAEMWPNSDDVGEETRILYCYEKGELRFLEAIQWSVPSFQDEKVKTWGYSRRWERDSDFKLRRVKVEFVDGEERPIARPKLGREDVESLNWKPPMGQLGEQKFPSALLK